MSAPHTNLDRQKRRHRGPLVGMGVVMAAVALGLFAFLVYEVKDPAEPAAPGIQIDNGAADRGN